jgi:sortase A
MSPDSDETVSLVPVDDPAARPGGAPRPRRNRVTGFVGLALVVAGALMLGYVGWQFFGTNYVASRTHDRIVDDLTRSWAGDSADRSRDAAGSGTGGGEGAPQPLSGEATALLRIPAFGDEYVVPVLEGIGDEELASGYGHFPGTAGPGEQGNYALAAHRVTHGEPLRDMPSLRPGDRVLVETADHVYTYELDTDPNELVVTFEEIWVTDPVPTNPRPGGVEPEQEAAQHLITLTTCAELFHTDDRMIAFGHLVDVAAK